MKKLEAIIRPHKVDEVREALLEAGFRGMTITEVKGVGRQKGHTEMYRGSEYKVDFVPKVKLELVISADQLESALSIIVQSARTGQIGDGKIFVSPVEEVIRVRTEEVGQEAL